MGEVIIRCDKTILRCHNPHDLLKSHILVHVQLTNDSHVLGPVVWPLAIRSGSTSGHTDDTRIEQIQRQLVEVPERFKRSIASGGRDFNSGSAK